MVTNAGMGGGGGGTMLPMSSSAASSSAAEASLSKLNPSVYSHPNAQDPVLMMPKSYQNHRDLVSACSGDLNNAGISVMWLGLIAKWSAIQTMI